MARQRKPRTRPQQAFPGAQAGSTSRPLAGRGPRRWRGELPRGGAEASRRARAESREEGALQQGAEPSRAATGRGGDWVTAAGPGRARYRAARTYRSGAGGTSTALPMGLCFPCPGESAPPTPNPVSKAASARLPAAPRAPVPGLGAREARSCGHLPGRLGALERAGEHAGGHPGGGDVWSRPEGPWGRASGTWTAASVWSPTLVT